MFEEIPSLLKLVPFIILALKTDDVECMKVVKYQSNKVAVWPVLCSSPEHIQGNKPTKLILRC